jgi:hypothetical protein
MGPTPKLKRNTEMNTTSLTTPVFELSIEPVGAPTYRDGFHLGTDEVIARRLAAEAFHQRKPRNGTAIRSVALFRAGKMVDCYDGHWASDLHDLAYAPRPATTAVPGTSISHGTARHEDLLGTFARVLRQLAIVEPRNEGHLALASDADAMVDRLASDQPFDADEPSELICDLIDALNHYSPEGYHFGAHEGDGSDFGWWENNPEDSEGWEEREAKATAAVNSQSSTAAIERRIASRFISDAIAAGYTLDVNDGEETVLVKSTDIDAILAAMFSTDEDILIVRRSDHRIGAVHLIHGNGGDLISDHTDTAEMRDLLAGADALTEAYSYPDAEVYMDRGFTLFDALSLPEGERRKIAKALANQTLLFRS